MHILHAAFISSSSLTCLSDICSTWSRGDRRKRTAAVRAAGAGTRRTTGSSTQIHLWISLHVKGAAWRRCQYPYPPCKGITGLHNELWSACRRSPLSTRPYLADENNREPLYIEHKSDDVIICNDCLAPPKLLVYIYNCAWYVGIAQDVETATDFAWFALCSHVSELWPALNTAYRWLQSTTILSDLGFTYS